MKFNCKALLLTLGTMAISLPSLRAEVTSFPIGTTWPDTEGVHINCHGGCVVPYNNAYYWFGESRTGGHSDGISVYRSTDLYNWENLGFAVTHQGERDDQNLQDISEGRLLERPKVIYNAATGKWVMWAHWENGSDYGQARVAILQADQITGPYEFKATMRPNGHDSRDQTLFLDTDGKAYHFCSTNMNTDINVVRLADDFLSPSSSETLIMKGRRLEATTVCKYGEMYFATFSECNGWDPAPGHTATTLGDPLGQWTEGLNFCTDADASRSYRSQGAYVFSVEGLGYDPKCFIFYGDRWNSQNVGGSTYVWLPMSIRSGYPTVRNYQTWDLDEVMSSMYRYKRADKITDGSEYLLLERRSDRLLSRMGRRAGFFIKNDDDRYNLVLTFKATDNPYVWQLRDEAGLYLAEDHGRLRMVDNPSEKTAWEFVLLADGYYNVINRATGNCLTINGSSRADGSEVILAVPGMNEAQAFAVYFDSDKHSYAEAPIYTAAYYAAVAQAMAAQNYQGSEVQLTLPLETGKAFALMHSTSGRALTSGERAFVSKFTKDDTQKITFTEATVTFTDFDEDTQTEGETHTATGYRIADGNGLYLTKVGDWNTGWTDDTDVLDSTHASLFAFEEHQGRYLIKCLENGRYLGTDSSDEGAEVYSDKSGAGRNLSYWHLEDFEASGVASPEQIFADALDQADITYGMIDQNWIGSMPFDYSEEAVTTFFNAIEKGFKVQNNYEAALEELNLAVAAFEANKLVLPVENRQYNIRHSSGLYLTTGETPALGADGEAADAKFIFAPAEDGYYTVQSFTTSLYLAKKRTSSWDCVWLNDGTNTLAHWSVDFSPLGGKVFFNRVRRLYLGSNDTTDGATLYTDKEATAPNSQWTIEDTDQAGIESVATSTEGDVAVRALHGAILILADNALADVYNSAGIKVASAKVNGRAMVNAAPGLYIVAVKTVGNTASFKLLVK